MKLAYAPQVHQVTGFLLDIDGAHGPRIWISGDTVMFPALHAALAAIGRAARSISPSSTRARGFGRAVHVRRGRRSPRARSSARGRSSRCTARAGRTSSNRRPT